MFLFVTNAYTCFHSEPTFYSLILDTSMGVVFV